MTAASKRRALMAKIARKRARHQSVVIELRALMKATTRALQRECRRPEQQSLPL
jgi:hypothetical protein